MEEAQTHVVRIYADEEGNSCLEELPITAGRSPGQTRQFFVTAGAELTLKEYRAKYSNDWHLVPCRRFAITIVGELEVEVSGGIRRKINTGELVFLEDTRGTGHVTRLSERVTNLFIDVPDTFDVVAWARGDT